MELLGDEAQVEARLVHLEIVLILTQDRCTVSAERTIGKENILDTPGGTPRRHGSSRFLFWYPCNISAQFAPNIPLAQKSFWMHLKGTPR